MFFLKLLAKLIKVLRSADKPSQLAGGFILGMMLGLISLKTLFAAPVILLIIILNVNLSMAVFSAILFRIIAYFVDPYLHHLGYWLLADLVSLKELWTSFYTIKFVPYTRFNNTVVMGSFVSSLILLIPIYIGVKRFMINYREKYQPKIEKLKFIKVLKGSKIYQVFARIINLGA